MKTKTDAELKKKRKEALDRNDILSFNYFDGQLWGRKEGREQRDKEVFIAIRQYFCDELKDLNDFNLDDLDKKLGYTPQEKEEWK